MSYSHRAFAQSSKKFHWYNRSRKDRWTILGIMSFLVVLTIGDMISDLAQGESVQHFSLEVAIAMGSIISIMLFWRLSSNLRIELNEEKENVTVAESARLQAELAAQEWREKAASVYRGLSDAIDSQMNSWKLTYAEKEVALLLLKGLSLKEIAEVRQVSEKTARAQSFSIYSKSGLSGRAELSAFFLEDLMLPANSQDSIEKPKPEISL